LEGLKTAESIIEKRAESFFDKRYEEEFEFPLWNLIKQRALVKQKRMMKRDFR
jgi:non-homologous end joining protein Ku